MAMAMAMQSMRSAAEAAIGRAAIFGEPPVRAACQLRKTPWAAVVSPHKTHRYGTDGRRTHHGQDHAARAFHGAAPLALFVLGRAIVAHAEAARQVKAGYVTTSCSARRTAHRAFLRYCGDVWEIDACSARLPGNTLLLRRCLQSDDVTENSALGSETETARQLPRFQGFDPLPGLTQFVIAPLKSRNR